LRKVLSGSAHLGRDSAQLVVGLGGRPYLRPKSDSKCRGRGRSAYEMMNDMFMDCQSEYVVYGRQWGIEACNFVLKNKFRS